MADNSWDGVLEDGEVLVWQGQPVAGRAFDFTLFMEVAMGVFFMGFSVVWMTMASMAGGVFWMFGLIFFAVGFYNAIGRWFWEPMLRRRTWYSLSDRRAFIARDHPVWGRKLTSYPITDKTQIEYEVGPPTSVWFARNLRKRNNGARSTKVGFAGIADGSEVLRLMHQIQEKAG